jgi:predicted PhzF superfamily epimerase YddE/YHI9
MLRAPKMKLPYYEISAFTTNPFGGNPAGVCVLDAWLPDAVLQNIAANNNLAETAFTVPCREPEPAGKGANAAQAPAQIPSLQPSPRLGGEREIEARVGSRGSDFELRWFTPTVEMDLCGHATLAAAAVLFAEHGWRGAEVRFHSRSGLLAVARSGNLLTLDFPARPPTPSLTSEPLIRGLGATPNEVFKARDYLAVFACEAEVRALKPDFAMLKTLDCLGIIATAPGSDCEFVSRFFAPGAGVEEDPVTGSAHCTLIPFWAQRLNKTKLFALQVSQRGGELFCELIGERVRIGGRAMLYLRGEIVVPD